MKDILIYILPYELTKFNRDKQLNLYHYFRSFRRIPRDVRVSALKKYRDDRDQPFNIILINEYRKYISNRYPIFNRLSDRQISDIAQNLYSGKLGRLAENLEYMINEELKVEDIRLKYIERLASLPKGEVKRYSKLKSMLKSKAEELGMRLSDRRIHSLYKVYNIRKTSEVYPSKRV